MTTMPPILTRYPAPISQNPPLHGPVLLRDGRPAYLREARPDDLNGLVELLNRSSNQSLMYRFFGTVAKSEQAAELLVKLTGDGSRPKGRFHGVSLVVTTGEGDEAEIIGVGSCVPTSAEDAEVAFLVRDDFQGKGIGTLMLERLALAAEQEGIKRLTATVLPDNARMLQVFRDSGYKIVREWEQGEVQISFEIEPTAESVERAEDRNRLATQASLAPLLRPRSVALVGASRNPRSVGSLVLHNLIFGGFQGPVYPVNPHADFVASIPAYPSVRDIPKPVDLAVIAVPANLVLGVVEDCAAKGVRGIVILTAGFAETGPEGKSLQERLVEKVRGHGMRMVGPNCLGILNTEPEVSLNATFAPMPPIAGRVAMSSQSGALGLVILDQAKQWGIGLSSFVSVGNKADVSGNDLLQYWEDDPNTAIILLYLESFGNPRRFSRIARRVARKKPILAVKSGRGTAGGKAAGSHTAALAGSDVGADALFRQAGVIRTDTLEEMFEVSSFLAHQPLPKGNRVAILTNAGGLGIICADMCEAAGLALPPISDETKRRLLEFLPQTAGLINPIDMIASAMPEEYARAVPIVLDDPNIDAVIVLYIAAGAAAVDEISKAITRGRAAAETQRTKPLLACIMGRQGMNVSLATEEEAIPSYLFPESAARALGRAVEYATWLQRPQGIIPVHSEIEIDRARDVCARAMTERGEGWLTPDEVNEVLRAFRIPFAETVLCRSAEEAQRTADRLGYPVAVKLASTTLIHKSDWQGVHLGLDTPEAVHAAVASIARKLEDAGRAGEMLGVTVQPMIKGGHEVMIGMTEDPSFGPLIGFGLGGVTVEVLGDAVFRITPLTDQDAIEMVRGIRGYKLLDGFRGAPPADKAALADMLLRVSRLVEEVPEISEMDFNPVRVFEEGKGAIVLDARIHVKRR
jgi:acetyl coenzyme A synthetase (ADP forming)-like protein